MGEYHTIVKPRGNGYETLCKVGTCDDWRYSRREEIETLAGVDAGRQADMQWALGNRKVDGPPCLFRFPFPDEDHKGLLSRVGCVSAINGRDMFKTWTFSVPDNVWPMFADVEHREMCQHIKAANSNGYGFNVFIPCPLSEGFPLRTSKGGASRILQVYGERYLPDDKGRMLPYTVLRCGYCETPLSLDATEAAALREALAEKYAQGQEWEKEIINRIRGRLEPLSAPPAIPVTPEGWPE